MKKLAAKAVALLIALSQFLIFSPGAAHAEVPGEKRMILVTAYYSPLPNQSFYVRGSYEADIRLNGRGTNGADGTEVYPGMLAAPKTYPFGTRVRIPGLGVGEVHDRGGAILAHKSYDRIDVWMGHGEEGLARALNWGARLVEGEVFWSPHQVQPGLYYGWVDGDLSDSLKKKFSRFKLQNPNVFKPKKSYTLNEQEIKAMQEAFTSFGHYDGPINGQYDDKTRAAILSYQLAENVIPHKTAAGAGNFGPKTRASLKEKIENFNVIVVKEQQRLGENSAQLRAGLGKKATGEDVVALQRMLWELGYYKGELHGRYNSETIDSVFEFQKDHGLVTSEWDRGAGYYGKQTHAKLTAAASNKIERVGKFPQEKQTWVPAKLDLPQIASMQFAPAPVVRQELHFAPLIREAIVKNSELIKYELDLHDRNADVVKLQNVLIKEGHLAEGLNTGYFGKKTQAAVLAFQLDKGIVSAETDIGAGRVGPKTLEKVNLLLP